MNVPMKGLVTSVIGEKVFFEFDLFNNEPARKEEWAIQQQALYGFKQKKHGFFEFQVVKSEKEESVRTIFWWCFKEPQSEAELRKHKEIEMRKKEKQKEREAVAV